ncbi:hypothetical protein [Amycolatopsis keratiniphila]|uniref:hypothetical protein n=1 Tax=Amycolatopsis keratiniphila TaxID=129921 RepID=UPI00087B41F2|nr:hypothetical protein [Amycolatopsis keratiniphila]OLZ52737.1 hypothetical protein BS330_22870 [Amycolatopsis keratiniphila subsp. nogabecina]SDU09397.1 hypothetical protein SAMN04489733_1075 [Amycolatopsis keratiniphila]
MGFKVDPEALDKCSKLFDRYGEHAGEVSSFFTGETSMSIHEEGLISILLGGHSSAVDGMDQRTEAMQETGANSAHTLTQVAENYRFRDGEGAAELDAGYKGGSPAPLTDNSSSVSDSVDNFEDRADPLSALDADLGKSVKPDGFDIEVCDWIDTKTREVTDKVSPAYWARQWLTQVVGGWAHWLGATEWDKDKDPFDWVLEAFGGEWKQWGRCALVWDACSEATERMATNIKYVPEALSHTWEGNAADAAMEYFQKLHSATKTESEAFTAVSALYKWQTESIYNAIQLLNDLINFALDLLADVLIAAGIGLVTGGIGLAVAAPTIALILTTVSAISSALTSTLNAARGFQHILEFFDVPDMPECELDDLGKKGDLGYPGPEKRS